jgi:hypothetical protein
LAGHRLAILFNPSEQREQLSSNLKLNKLCWLHINVNNFGYIVPYLKQASMTKGNAIPALLS